MILVDPDQNINSGARDDLDVYRATAIIPSITIGKPVTLENAQDVLFHTSLPTGDGANSSVPDTNSDRLHIDTLINGSYEIISIDLGLSASDLSSTLLDVTEPNTSGTNWINYDLRSLENDLGISDFGDATFHLYFNSLSDPAPITIVDKGGISSSQGFVQIDDSDVSDISKKNRSRISCNGF